MSELYPPAEIEEFDETSVFSYVKSCLGFPIIEVEADDTQLRDFLRQGLELYSRMIPDIRWFSLPAYAGVQEYKPPRDTIGYGIVDVMIPRIDPIAPLMLSSGPRLDIFGYRYSYPYRDISELYTDYMYFQEATRILSARFEWEYFNGAIYVTPKPDEPFPLTYASAFPRNLDTMPKTDIDWIRDYVLGKAEIAVGRVRGKFVLPGSHSMQQMDGAQLRQEGQVRLDKLEAELRSRTVPLPIFRN